MRDWLREYSERPQRLRDNLETATLALTTTFKVPQARAREIVRRAHITWKDSEGEAVVKVVRALHHQRRGGRER